MARQVGHVLAEQQHLARGGGEYSGDQIEQRRLAGAVWTDDGFAVAGHDLERDVAHGAQAAEALRKALQLECWLAAARARIGVHVGPPHRSSVKRPGLPTRSPGQLLR